MEWKTMTAKQRQKIARQKRLSKPVFTHVAIAGMHHAPCMTKKHCPVVSELDMLKLKDEDPVPVNEEPFTFTGTYDGLHPCTGAEYQTICQQIRAQNSPSASIDDYYGLGNIRKTILKKA